MADTKIKFQVEGIQNIKTEMSSILKDVISQTNLIDTSNKEFVKSLKEQISLLKERNKINSQFISGALPNQQISDPSIGITLKDLNSTLRELVEKLEEDTSPKVRNEPSLNETQSTAKGLNPKMLQSFALSNIINPMSSNDPIDAGFGLLQNTGSSLMMMGGKAGIAGLGIALAASIGKMQVDILRKIEPNAARMARLQGGRSSEYFNSGINPYSDLGYQRVGVLENRADLIKALGGDSSRDLRSLLTIQRGFDISQSDILNLATLGRGEKNFDLGRTFRGLYSNLRSSIGREKTDALIPEYLKILTELGKEQLATLGKVDTGVNTKLITALSGEQRLQNPETLKGVVSGITRGITEAKTPQIEALQFQTLAKAFPGKNLLQLEMIREAPFEKGNERYLPEFLKSLKSVSSSDSDFIRAISTNFGIGLNLSASVANLYERGNFDLLKKELSTSGITEQEVYKRAIDATDRFEKAIAKFEEMKIGGITEAINNGFDRLLSNTDVSSAMSRAGVNIPGGSYFQNSFMQLAAPYIIKVLPK